MLTFMYFMQGSTKVESPKRVYKIFGIKKNYIIKRFGSSGPKIIQNFLGGFQLGGTQKKFIRTQNILGPNKLQFLLKCSYYIAIKGLTKVEYKKIPK